MTFRLTIDRSKSVPGRIAVREKSGRIGEAYDAVQPGAVEALARNLAKAIEGEVRFDSGSRALYATDASNYRQVPVGVVVPRTIDDVVTTIALCHRHDVPIVNRGGGTALAGQGCNVAVLIDFSKYLGGIHDLDPLRRLARVEPGCVLDTLRDAAEQHHLTFGPDPATHDHNTLGGMLGNNSCGPHSVIAGRTSDNVEEMDVVTYDGHRMTVGRTSEADLRSLLSAGGRTAEIYRQLDEFRRKHRDLILAKYPKIPRRVSGYENLDELLPENGFNVARALVGTESTCVTILGATLKLIQSPRARALAVIGFADVFAAADAVPDVLSFEPMALEGIDEELVDLIRARHFHPERLSVLPGGGGWLVGEFGGEDEAAAEAHAERLCAAYRERGHEAKLLARPEEQTKLWSVREAALAVTAHRPDTWPGWEDSAVPREALGAYLRAFKALLGRFGYDASLYGHFGDGLVHCSINFDLRTERGLKIWQEFLEAAADLVVQYGGSLSGEHGDGQARGALLEKMYGKELVAAFREFKTIWDPAGRMNPGKIVDPFPIASNLRLGPDHAPPQLRGHFAYADDRGSFTQAMTRCVGVGKCRRHDSTDGVMCPSYMATLEESYSTRGRARLLFEMLQGDAITDLWRSKSVESALDMCLGCKGCKSDCPVNVDMATYKAEFRSNHYKHRLRPRAAYSMGLIRDWSRLASLAPSASNFFAQTPYLSTLVKWLGGVAEERALPRFANQTFTSWFRQRGSKHSDRPKVMLWPDTFNNYFRPQTAIAATEVLEGLGFKVVIPERSLCCGRPLYDWGMLDRAKRLWTENLQTLSQEIREGTPIVGLEPACVSSFRDELVGLFPADERARRLSKQTLLFSEFIDQRCPDAALPAAASPALMHVHCHHHAIIKPDAEIRLLQRLGAPPDVIPSGCCGMAGAFGFESAKFDISMTIAERVLLPRVRAAPSDVAILANGFSCREQIEQGTRRRTLHLAEFMRQAMSAPSR